jgi:hypothetical protein
MAAGFDLMERRCQQALISYHKCIVDIVFIHDEVRSHRRQKADLPETNKQLQHRSTVGAGI